jgi:hypothetical protein
MGLQMGSGFLSDLSFFGTGWESGRKKRFEAHICILSVESREEERG